MNSETRTKITSWLKSPKSLAAKAGISLAAVAVVSVGTVSALTVANSMNDHNTTQNSAKTLESAQNDVKPANNSQKSTELDQKQPDVAVNPANSTENHTSNAQTEPAPAQNTEPAAPAPAVYADTYPVDLRNATINTKIDQWGLNNRQSTSYTAWKVSESGKNMPKWGYMGKGDANMWVSNANSAGLTVSNTPKVGSVAVSGNFTAWVEAVNGDKIDVSFYNWGNNGSFGYWNDIPASQFADYIYF